MNYPLLSVIPRSANVLLELFSNDNSLSLAWSSLNPKTWWVNSLGEFNEKILANKGALNFFSKVDVVVVHVDEIRAIKDRFFNIDSVLAENAVIILNYSNIANNPISNHSFNEDVKNSLFDMGYLVYKITSPSNQSRIFVAIRKSYDSCLYYHQINMVEKFMDVRTRIPYLALSSLPGVFASMVGLEATVPKINLNIPKILVIQRSVTSDPSLWNGSIKKLLSAGWLIISEWDDHPNLLPMKIKKLWDEYSWANISTTHACQVSTPHLKKVFEKYVSEVSCFNNMLESIPSFGVGTKKNRIVFAALNRQSVNVWLTAILRRVITNFPDWDVILIGNPELYSNLVGGETSYKKNISDGIAIQADTYGSGRVMSLPPVSYNIYMKILAESKLALLPLSGDLPELYKSDIKFVECAANGVAVVASRSIYKDSIAEGGGYLANDADDWYKKIKTILLDEELRMRMVLRSYEYVKNQRLIAYQVQSRLDWYKYLWSIKLQLDDELRARHPELFD